MLEIIGNAKEVTRIMKHFRKMFAGSIFLFIHLLLDCSIFNPLSLGLAMLVLEEDGTVVSGMSSREGETVMFTEKINLKEYPRINEWLTKVETEMKITLAKGAEKSIEQRRSIKKVTIAQKIPLFI